MKQSINSLIKTFLQVNILLVHILKWDGVGISQLTDPSDKMQTQTQRSWLFQT